MKQTTNQQLHALETDIMQARGLLQALQALDCNDGKTIALMNALEQQVGLLEQNFYELWKEVADDGH